MTILNEVNPPLDEALEHFGVKGMHWGVRKNDYPGASKKTNKEARSDATEFARAKMFFGKGAGTRRKLIKATVESKSKKDETYKKAFEHHLGQQDLGAHANKARGERKRKDVTASTAKTGRGIVNILNGNPQAASAVAAAAVAGGMAIKQSGAHKVIAKHGKTLVKDIQKMPQRKKDAKIVTDLFKNAKWD